MSSKVIKWFKRQASIRRFTEKKDDNNKPVSGPKEPSEEKRKLSFGRLSFRKKHKRKPSSTAELEGNLAIVGISKKYSYSVPNEMEGDKVLTNGATNTVSLDNSSCTNSPTKIYSSSKSVSDLSYHSSFDNEAHSSEFSREFDNTPLLSDSPTNESEKLEADSDASKLSDTFHTGLTSLDKSSLETETIRYQCSPIPDQTDLENSSNLETLSPNISSAEAQMHPQDIKRDKAVIPTIVIESVPNKPPLAEIESYSSDDLSGLSDIDDTEMNKDRESVASVEENVINCKEIDTSVENIKSPSNAKETSSAETTSIKKITIVECVNASTKETDSSIESKTAPNFDVKKNSCAEVIPIRELSIAVCDKVSTNDDNKVHSFSKSYETISINCVNDISINLRDLNQQKLEDDITPSSSDSVSSVINVIELQSLEKDEEKIENGLSTTFDHISIPGDAKNISNIVTKLETPTIDNLSVQEEADSLPDEQNSFKNKKLNEKLQDEVLELKSQADESKNLFPKLSEETVIKNESVQSDKNLVRSSEPRNEISQKTSAKKTVEYPEDLNPFGDESEENSSLMYPSLVEFKETSSNPFGSDNEDEKNSKHMHDKNTIFLAGLNGTFESVSSNISQRKISSSESEVNKKSLNPFGDSDDEDSVDLNAVSQTSCKGEIPPRLPPKLDFQKRKYSGASLAPVPRPRKTKQHHGSTSSLQNVSTFPIPAPRSVTPFGSTRTLNESTSSMNPFDEDEDEAPSNISFERRGIGRNTTQFQATEPEGEKNSEEPFPRNGVRASLPSTGRFRPKKKRQAPLPPGTVINKPPQSPVPNLVNSTSDGHRKRSSTSPSYDTVFEVKPRGSKSPSPRRIPPPRPPLPSQ